MAPQKPRKQNQQKQKNKNEIKDTGDNKVQQRQQPTALVGLTFENNNFSVTQKKTLLRLLLLLQLLRWVLTENKFRNVSCPQFLLLAPTRSCPLKQRLITKKLPYTFFHLLLFSSSPSSSSSLYMNTQRIPQRQLNQTSYTDGSFISLPPPISQPPAQPH